MLQINGWVAKQKENKYLVIETFKIDTPLSKKKTVVIFTVTSANKPSNCMELEGGLLPLEEGKGRQAAQ